MNGTKFEIPQLKKKNTKKSSQSPIQFLFNLASQLNIANILQCRKNEFPRFLCEIYCHSVPTLEYLYHGSRVIATALQSQHPIPWDPKVTAKQTVVHVLSASNNVHYVWVLVHIRAEAQSIFYNRRKKYTNLKHISQCRSCPLRSLQTHPLLEQKAATLLFLEKFAKILSLCQYVDRLQSVIILYSLCVCVSVSQCVAGVCHSTSAISLP